MLSFYPFRANWNLLSGHASYLSFCFRVVQYAFHQLYGNKPDDTLIHDFCLRNL
jgi:hypothetical protein